jgi:hypothetical protein
VRILPARGGGKLAALLAKVREFATDVRSPNDNTPVAKPFVLDYTPSYSGFTRWRSNPNWPGRRAAAALRRAGKTRRMR